MAKRKVRKKGDPHMRVHQYVDRAGRFCPYCVGDSIEGHSVETGDGGAMQEMSCNDCGNHWTDIYKLTSYSKG